MPQESRTAVAGVVYKTSKKKNQNSKHENTQNKKKAEKVGMKSCALVQLHVDLFKRQARKQI